MAHVIAMLFFVVVTLSPPTQDESKKVLQPDKADTNRHDSGRKKHLPPALTLPENHAELPILKYNLTYATDEAGKAPHNLIDYLNAFSTFSVAIATIVMVVVVYNQSQATKTAERAWIVPEIQFPLLESVDGGIEVLNHFLNKGRTPAWVTGMGSRGQVLRPENELPPEPTYTLAGPFPAGGNVLPPGAYTRQGLPLNAQQWASIEKGESVFYFYGFVAYRDIFGGNHETRYCFRFKPAPTDTDPSPRDFYVTGPTGYNRAT